MTDKGLDYESIFPALTGQYLILDPDFYILQMSDVFLRANKMKREQVLGQSLFSIFPDANTSSILKNSFAKVIKDKIVDQVTINKEQKIWQITTKAIFDNASEIKYFLLHAEDITEKSKNQHIKNEFISVVSHELRTPLTSIQGSLSLLLGGVSGQMSPKAERLLTIAQTNSERLIQLINDILDVEKIETGKTKFHFHPEHVDTLVRDSIDEIKPFADKFNIKVNLDVQTHSLVNVDKQRLLQVLANLLSNAIKFAQKGSDVKVAIIPYEQYVRIKVTNIGSGIPEAFRKQIFQKFTQFNSSSTRETGGTGLGLNISKQIVNRLNGHIDFVSVENGETTFYVDLPTHHEVITPKQVFGEKPTLLVCEDDVESSKYLKELLLAHNCNVIVTYNASDTKKIIQEQHIDALLLDLILPDQDGIELIKELKNDPKNSAFPIIVISVKAEVSKNLLKGSSITVLDWIQKPAADGRILDAIERIKKYIVGTKPKILHIEDDSSLLEIVADLLQGESIITTVRTMAQAEDELEKHTFDLVILDLLLEDGISVELLPLISKKHVPVIVFSAYDLPADYNQYVVRSLVKSRSSTHEFFDAIKSTLKKKNIKEEDYVK